MNRRRFLGSVGRAGAVAATLGVVPAWACAAADVVGPPDLIERNAWPEHHETTLAALGRSWITRTDRFFVRSHFPAPEVDPARYRLEIVGLVRNPVTLAFDGLKALPATAATHTLECAGNGRGLFALASTSGTQWERGAVGNATWSGVSLASLLRRAEPRPEAKHVWFEAADAATLPEVPPFLRSIPIAKAMDDTLLATAMNGAPLTRLYGAPVRAIVPGWYGMAWTKWVTRVRVEAAPSTNHFMAKGYRYVYPGEDPALAPPVEEMKVKSLITRPLVGARVPRGRVRVEGFAWAGPSGVRGVELSIDGGGTWRPTELLGERAPNAWRAWAVELEMKAAARVTAMARATDGAGERQPLTARPNAAGYANKLHPRGELPCRVGR